MSRMTITSYRDIEAERRRAEQREIQRLRKGLQHCLRLERELATLEDVKIGEYAQLLVRLDGGQNTVGQTISSSERRQWLDRLPNDAERLEGAITTAHERRIQLEFSALSLVRSADVEVRRTLEECARRARRANRNEFLSLRRKVEAIVTSRITATRPAPGQTPTEESLKLARSLMLSVQATERDALPRQRTLIEAKLEKLIANIAALGPEAENLLERAQKLLPMHDDRGFDLKLDSLMIEASELSAAARRRSELDEAIDAAEAALVPFDDPSSAALKARLAELRSTVDTDVINTVVFEAKKRADQLAAESDGQRARSAILEGLQELGYEVCLQSDSWRPGERIAAQKPDERNYDIQLAAAPDGRIQSKVRAYAHAGRSPDLNMRDVEVEASWCEDLKALNSRLSVSGLKAQLNHEDPPGSGVHKPIERSGFELDKVMLPPRSGGQQAS